MFFLRFDVKIGSIDGVEVFEFVRPYLSPWYSKEGVSWQNKTVSIEMMDLSGPESEKKKKKRKKNFCMIFK